MAEERKIAKEHGHPDPINDTYNDTTTSYHSVVDFILPLIAVGDAGVMIASHNEQTVDYVRQRYNSILLKSSKRITQPQNRRFHRTFRLKFHLKSLRRSH